MDIPHEFLKREIGTDQTRAKAFAFAFLLKGKLSNGVVYKARKGRKKNKYKKRLSGNSYIASIVGMDRNTVAMYMALIKEYGWVKYSGGNLRLKSFDKDFDYRLKPNGKTDKKHQTKYFRITVKDKDTMATLTAMVRGLMIKLHEQWKAFSNLNNAAEDISEKELKKAKRRMWDFRSRKNLNPEKLVTQVRIPLELMAKILKMSKSTAYRTVVTLKKSRRITVTPGKYKKLGMTDGLNPKATMPYGGFVFGKVVLKKECNAYGF